MVLAKRRGARMVRTRVEVQEQTEIGDAMIRGLVRAQLSLATRVAAAVGLLFAVVPVLLLVFPDVADVVVFGVRLPWLLAVSVPLPILLVAGWFYIRAAERNEQDFADLVDD
ncbi:hypothetical protein [Prescottella equi]|uniref:hypothetical protein n=1 Tax=Prescottella TaxID=2979332 RepID=UPI000A118EAE|nr:hypothetical protein [Prescottella equi]MBM4555718.1 hypothetical protein [Prescottella equi]MBM4722016.1 hypothetical protein [Prescottella equi]MBM4734580.1 hypothetical protein [Prescottella equi]NKR24569.1 hypothetical protein [Prescottella equi]